MTPQFMTGLLLALAFSVPSVGGAIRMVRELHGVNASRPYPHGLPLVPGTDEFILFWEPETDSIIFEMHARTLGWVGLGISKTGGMRQADLVMAWIQQDGKPVIEDRFAIDSSSYPSLDAEQDVELLGAHQTATHTMIRFRRPIKTCHQDDVTIETMTARVIWAYGSSAPAEGEKPHYHRSARGVMSVSLLATGQESRYLPSDAFAWDLTVKNITIPKKHTTYWCLMAKAPEEKHHMVMFEPLHTPGNEAFLHHMLVHLCHHEVPEEHAGLSGECFADMPRSVLQCNHVFIAWTVGFGQIFMPNHLGVQIGGPNAPRFVRVEMHYDNPGGRENVLDSSGLRAWLTPTLRRHDAGTIQAGHIIGYSQVIPPYSPSFTTTGHCPGECLKQAFTVGNVSHVNISIVGLHTHLIGSAVHVRHFRDGQELPPIAIDDYYDFNMQPFKVLDQEVVLQPNDDITVECYYDSTKRTSITTGGLTTRDEMCLAYFLYHPAIPLAICSTSPAEETLLSFVGAEQQDGMNYYQMVRRIQQGLMVQNWGDAEVRQRLQETVNGGDYKARCRGENIVYPINRKTVRMEPRGKIMMPKVQCDGSSLGQANDGGNNGGHKSTPVASWLVSFILVIFMLT